MARIDVLPSIEIIRGLKGILDFYVWKGLPCVRAWPKYRPARQTAASLAAALFFGAVVKSYTLLGDLPLEAYREDAADQPRSARDIFVSGVFGHLHEADMSDFLTLLVECRDFLSNLTALLNALDSISADEIDVNIERSVLPTGAAIAANQATAIAALQKLDDLQDALQSKGLDRLLVRGMDQLFSFKGILACTATGPISGQNGYKDSVPCPEGELWHVSNILSLNSTSPTTAHRGALRHNAVNHGFFEHLAAIAAFERKYWSGSVSLDPGDVVRVTFDGGQVADSCYVVLIGYIMTLDT